jgi:alpha-tubulin suppressor-like RCC1 family protein
VSFGLEAMARHIPDVVRLSAWGRSSARGAAFWAALSAAVSCGGEVTRPPLPLAESLTIEPREVEITERGTRQLVAVVRGKSGQPIRDAAVFWVSRNPSVLGVDPAGLASGLPTMAAVRTWVVAYHGSLADSIAVTVMPRIGSVEIRQGAGPISVSWPDTTVLTALVNNDQGVELTGELVVTWTSSDPTRVSVTPVRHTLKGGYVVIDRRTVSARIVSLGEATITVTVGEKSAQVVIRGGLSPDARPVVWPDTSRLPVATTRTLMVQQVGAREVLRAPRWESSDPSVATVDDLGQVTAVGDGAATITAVLHDRRLSAQVVVYRYAAPLRFTRVTAGSNHTCALTADGAAYCWGQNDSSQLGSDDVMDRCGIVGVSAHRCSEAPIPVKTPQRFTSISAGGSVTCGLTAEGRAYCWGANAGGGTGTGLADATVRTPTEVAGGLTFSTIDVGWLRTCGVTASGAAYCWGWRWSGNGEFQGSRTPVLVSGNLTWKTIDTWSHTACGLTTHGTPYCWGLNTSAQAGVPRETINCPNQSSEHLCVPTRVNTTLKFVQVESNGSQTCGIATDSRTYCWGTVVPHSGWLESTPVPSAVSGTLTFARLNVRRRPCGVTSGGAVHCWGGSPYDPTPVASPPSFAVREFVQGSYHACATDGDGILSCWDATSSALPFVWASVSTQVVTGSTTPTVVTGQR